MNKIKLLYNLVDLERGDSLNIIVGNNEVSIVTNEKNSQAQNLYVASLKSYNPRKILHYEKPGRYPDKGQAILYICTPDRCSPPLANNDKIDFYINEFK